MTKPRAPLTIDAALARIAGQLGSWKLMADEVGRAERTVRNWGDPDTPEQIPMDAAIALDILFQRHGGDGFPIFETYARQLELARTEVFTDQAAIARLAGIAAKEGGEALQALIAAQLPGATARDRLDAAREVSEALTAFQATLPSLTDGAGPDGNAGEGRSPGGES